MTFASEGFLGVVKLWEGKGKGKKVLTSGKKEDEAAAGKEQRENVCKALLGRLSELRLVREGEKWSVTRR